VEGKCQNIDIIGAALGDPLLCLCNLGSVVLAVNYSHWRRCHAQKDEIQRQALLPGEVSGVLLNFLKCYAGSDDLLHIGMLQNRFGPTSQDR
jgi:hypothetical protein